MNSKLLSKIVIATLVVVALVTSNHCDALEERNVDVGALCSSTSDCGSDLLYCSSEGVCLCDAQRANFVYEYRQHFTIREPKCEVLPCTIAKEEERNECNLRHARCLRHPDGDELTGFCKCPGQQVGARRGSAFTLSHCKDVINSNVGEKCISNLYICEVSKKLKCRDGSCECYDGHLFSFEENMCIREEEYVQKYGYDRLGSYGQYCSRSSDCMSGMFCQNKRCDCPLFCRSGEYIKTPEVCYCAFDMTRLAYIIPCIVITILFILFFSGLCYFNRKYNESLRAQSNLVLVHGRGGNTCRGSPQFIYGDLANEVRRSPMRSPLRSPLRSPMMSPMRSPCIARPSRPYSLLSAQANAQQRPLHEEPVWDNTNPASPSESPEQTVPGVNIDVQQLSVGNFNSFYPPPPYQLNELVAAGVVEAQMRQPSPVLSQYRDRD